MFNPKFYILPPLAGSRPPFKFFKISGGINSKFQSLGCLAVILIFWGIVLPNMVRALTFSPPLFEFELKSGASINDKFVLYNEGDTSKTLYVSLENFKLGSNGISPEFVLWENHELANWITVKEPRVILKSKERRFVEFSIKAPPGAIAGGHYGAILWTESPLADEPASARVASKTGPLILVNLAGKDEEAAPALAGGQAAPQAPQAGGQAGELLDFVPFQKFYEYLPVNFLINFKNNGATHLKPSGEIRIKNFWGKIAAAISINEYGGNVLPQSSRKFEAVWQKEADLEKVSPRKVDFKNLTAGRFTAELILEYGKEPKTIKAEKSFWVIPWRVGGLGLGAILGAFLIVAHGFKRYNKWLIRKYLKSLE